MIENIINDIIQGIAKELKTIFPQINIYDEGIEQGYEEPCFFVVWENDDEKKLVGNRYDFELHFRIIYFQDLKETDANNKIYNVRGKLEGKFYHVEYNKKYFRIIEKHFDRQDKDLHFTFTVKCQIKLQDEENLLNNIENLSEERKDERV